MNCFINMSKSVQSVMMSFYIHWDRNTVKRSNARWRLSVAKVRWSDVFRDETSKIAFDAKIVECIDDFVCFFEVLKFNDCLLTQTRRLMLAKIADWLTDCKTNYWLFDRNVDSLHLIDLFRWLDYRKLDKAKLINSYETFRWNRLIFFRHEELNFRFRFQMIVNENWNRRIVFFIFMIWKI